MDRLTQLLWQETTMWPWNLKNRGLDSNRIEINNKKFTVRVRLYFTRLEIEYLYILPQYRRQKLGTAIITALEKYACEQSLSMQVNYPLPQTAKFWDKMQLQKNIRLFE